VRSQSSAFNLSALVLFVAVTTSHALAAGATQEASSFGLEGRLFIGLLFIIYFVPTVVGFVRDHPNKFPILALNVFLGWSFIGWVVALIWALSNPSPSGGGTVVINNQHISRSGDGTSSS
jgi:hypothetical protein